MNLELKIEILMALAAVAIFIFAKRKRPSEDDAERKRAALERYKAHRFVEDFKVTGRVPTRQVSIILKTGERGVFEEPSILHESKSFRVFGGAGTRLGGISFGGGASQSLSRVQPLDSGALVLTTQRLVFDGQQANREIKLSDILSINQVHGGIEVSASRRQKSLIFAVENPGLWKVVAEGLAKGSFRA